MMLKIGLILFAFASTAFAETPYEASVRRAQEKEKIAQQLSYEQRTEFRNQEMRNSLSIFARQLRQTVNENSVQCDADRNGFLQKCDFTTQALSCRVSRGDAAEPIYREGSIYYRRVLLLQCRDTKDREIIRRIPVKKID